MFERLPDRTLLYLLKRDVFKSSRGAEPRTSLTNQIIQ